MKQKIRALAINVDKGEVNETYVGGLEDYYKEIGCKLIDIVKMSVGGKYYNVVCDDEGLLKRDFIVSATSGRQNHPMLVGNLVVVGEENQEGDLTGLTQEDIDHLLKHTGSTFDTGRQIFYYRLKTD